MEWFNLKRQFDFVGKRRWAFALSGLLLLISVVSIAVQGLQLAVGFTGGYLLRVEFAEPVELPPVREALAGAGFGDAQVQHFGSRDAVLVRIGPHENVNEEGLSRRIVGALDARFEQSVELRRFEFVGPQVGEELRDKGGLAVLVALLMILAYVAFRFEKRFAVGAVAALIHDIVIVVGVFSVFQIEFDLPVVAALLATLGYSVNDTIVVFDRIRENFRRKRRGSVAEITNDAINQTLSRTLMTSIATILVLLALLFVGGEAIFSFAIAMLVGVLVGTYSSIFVASALVLASGLSREDMLPVEKEGAGADSQP